MIQNMQNTYPEEKSEMQFFPFDKVRFQNQDVDEFTVDNLLWKGFEEDKLFWFESFAELCQNWKSSRLYQPAKDFSEMFLAQILRVLNVFQRSISMI